MNSLSVGKMHNQADCNELLAEARQWFQALVQINSSNPPGNEGAVVAFVESVLKPLKIPVSRSECEAGRPNLIAGRISHENAATGLILSAHADTVPVPDANEWSQDPFGGKLHDGCIWGRGALDMKFKIAFDMALMKWAYREGCAAGVMQVVVAGEETGGSIGSQYLCTQQRELLGGRYVINEIGGFPLSIAGKEIFLIQSGEKGHISLELAFKGGSVHASTPLSGLRLEKVFKFIEQFCATIEAYGLCTSSKQFLDGLKRVLPAELHPLVEGLASSEQVSATLETLAAMDATLAAQIRAMLFTTCTPTLCRLGAIENILNPSGQVHFDIRILPGTDLKNFIDTIHTRVRELASDTDFSVTATVLHAASGYEIPVSDPLFKHCATLLGEYAGRTDRVSPVAGFLLPASSDSSHYAGAGLIPLGFSPLIFPSDFPGFVLAHAPDERVPVVAFDKGLTLYIKTLGTYLKQIAGNR